MVRTTHSENMKALAKKLREEMAINGKNFLIKSFDSNLLESFTACKLLAMDKNPGIRLIGVGEVIRRIIGKAMVFGIKRDLNVISVKALSTRKII